MDVGSGWTARRRRGVGTPQGIDGVGEGHVQAAVTSPMDASALAPPVASDGPSRRPIASRTTRAVSLSPRRRRGSARWQARRRRRPGLFTGDRSAPRRAAGIGGASKLALTVARLIGTLCLHTTENAAALIALLSRSRQLCHHRAPFASLTRFSSAVSPGPFVRKVAARCIGLSTALRSGTCSSDHRPSSSP